jgi:hypothetical protein
MVLLQRGLKIKKKKKKKKKKRRRRRRRMNEYLFFNFKTTGIYIKYENIIINFKTIINTTF